MSGQGELPRENLFIHYEPRWPTALPARYAFDRRWKLYEGGEFYDMQSDPLEKSPLDLSLLDSRAAAAYDALTSRLDGMPGQLSSTRRWLPPVAYKLMAITVLVVTCTLAFLQLWHPAFLEAIRSTFLGRTLIGTTFAWWDLPHYAVGCALGTWLGSLLRGGGSR